MTQVSKTHSGELERIESYQSDSSSSPPSFPSPRSVTSKAFGSVLNGDVNISSALGLTGVLTGEFVRTMSIGPPSKRATCETSWPDARLRKASNDSATWLADFEDLRCSSAEAASCSDVAFNCSEV